MNCDRVFAVLTSGPFPTGAPSDEAVEFHLATCSDCRRLAEALRPAGRAVDEPGARSPGMIGRMVEEIVGAEERRGLPGYWGEASCEAADEILARFSAANGGPGRESTSSKVRPTRFWRRSSFWMFGLAVCVGVSLSAAVRYWATMAGPPLWGGAGHRVVSIHAEQAPHADSPRLLATNHELLANLRLPAACLSPPQGANSLVQTAHAAAAEGPPRQTPVGRVGEGRPMHSLASFPTPSTHQECCTKCHHAGAGKEIPAAAASTVRHNCVLCHGDMPRAAADAW